MPILLRCAKVGAILYVHLDAPAVLGDLAGLPRSSHSLPGTTGSALRVMTIANAVACEQSTFGLRSDWPLRH